MENKRLFVLSPTNSGSSFLTKSLLMCKYTVGIPGVYSAEAALMPEAKHWGIRGAQKRRTGRVGDNFDLEVMRDIVENAWTNHENYAIEGRVLIEKSPGYDIFNAQKLEKVFKNSYFIILMRNPVAFLEGVKRREGDWTQSSRVRIVDYWKQCAYKQKENYEKLEFPVLFTYEVMCDYPKQVESLIKDYLCPNVFDFSLRKEVRCGSILHKGNVAEKIRNYNDEQIKTMSQDDIDFVWERLDKDRELLEFFGYEPEYKFGGSS